MSPKHTPLRSLTPTRCWELLQQHEVGRLIVCVDGQPDAFPVNYRTGDEKLVIRTDDGPILASVHASPTIAFEVDALDRTSRTGWSVVVKGAATEPQHIEDYLQAETLGVHPWPTGPRDRYLIIAPDTITGTVLPPATSAVVLHST